MVELFMGQETKEERRERTLKDVSQIFGHMTVRVRVNERGQPKEVSFGDPWALSYTELPCNPMPDVLVPKFSLLKMADRGQIIKDVGKRVAEHVFYLYLNPNESKQLLTILDKESV